MLKNRISKIFYTVFFLFIVLTQKVNAGFLDDAGIDEACMTRGRCSLDDVAAGFISLIRMLLGSIAAIALVLLIWGGVQWVWSGGNADKVKRGKDIFFNTIAALVLAFGSYMIIGFFINDILQPKAEYRVVSENADNLNQCRFQRLGEPCNLPEQNYVCSGPEAGERCIEVCDLPRVLPPLASILNGAGLSFDCASLNANPDAYHITNNCSGDNDNVCILFNSAGVVSVEEFDGDPSYQDAVQLLHAIGWN